LPTISAGSWPISSRGFKRWGGFVVRILPPHCSFRSRSVSHWGLRSSGENFSTRNSPANPRLRHQRSLKPDKMLKKSLFSPAQPRCAKTHLSPSSVLASLRGSTYRSVRLASSLAAALLNGLFEHPVGVCASSLRRAGHQSSAHLSDIPTAC